MPAKMESTISAAKTLKFDGGFVDLNGQEVPLKAVLNFGFPYEPLEMNWELFREVKTILQDWVQEVIREHKLGWPVVFPDMIAYYAHHCSPRSFRTGSQTEKKPNLYIFSKYLLIANLFDELITARGFKDDPDYNEKITMTAELVYKMITLPFNTSDECQEEIDKSVVLKELSRDYAIYFGPICAFSFEFAKDLKTHCQILGDEEDTQLKKFAKALRRRHLCHRVPEKDASNEDDFGSKYLTQVVNFNLTPRDTHRYEVMGLTPIYELCLLLDDPNANDDQQIRRLALHGSTLMGLVGDLVDLKRDKITAIPTNSSEKPVGQLMNGVLSNYKQGLNWEASVAKIVHLHNETLNGFRQIYDNLMIDFAKSESQQKLVVLVKDLVEHGPLYHMVKGGMGCKFEYEIVE